MGWYDVHVDGCCCCVWVCLVARVSGASTQATTYAAHETAHAFISTPTNLITNCDPDRDPDPDSDRKPDPDPNPNPTPTVTRLWRTTYPWGGDGDRKTASCGTKPWAWEPLCVLRVASTGLPCSRLGSLLVSLGAAQRRVGETVRCRRVALQRPHRAVDAALQNTHTHIHVRVLAHSYYL